MPHTARQPAELHSLQHTIMMCPAAAVLLLVLVPLVHGEIDWRSEPKWGYQFILGSDGQLECNDTNAMLEMGDTVTWVAPNKMMIQGTSGRNDEKYEVIDKNSVRGMVLKIKKITSEDHGVYICMVKRNSADYVRVIRALNLYEPAYSSMIDKYRNNIMVGGIAAAVLFVPLVGACLINKFRYKSEEEKDRKRHHRERAQQIQHEYQQQMDNGDGGILQRKTAPENDGFQNEAFQTDTTRL
ncbi:uncharacterized protein LOC121374356 [Gigantopelta aegis]|uniref:uncharacterized protein LOC121374356 n=1 Tax=Gigantopelta aegis TaxID=1735272 RepID=UPI001B88BC3D|nr:uncharacterized protein LOC121374356 [Gigantopelta aegis]